MTWFRILQLMLGVYRADLPEVPPPHILWGIVESAVTAERDDVDAPLLLAITAYESHWDPRVVSWVDRDGVRHTQWTHDTAPPFSLRRGGLYCGLTQATATSWADCESLRRVSAIYFATVHELFANLREPGVKNLPQAVAVYRAGNNFRQPGIVAKVKFLYHKAAKIRGYP